jgi:phage shock protein A
MGLLDRTSERARRRVDRLLDTLEDPAATAAYDAERLRDELDAVDAAVVDLVAERKRQEARADRLADRVEEHAASAREAVAASREDLARELLSRKHEAERRRADAADRAADLRDAEAELRERRTRLHERARTERVRATERAAEERVAAASATVDELSASSVDESAARAAALAELRDDGFFDDPAAELEREQTREEVEAELDTLRTQIRGEDDETADGP